MRIYVANLAKYNEGEIAGEWFELPVDMEEVFETIFEEHELDEHGQPHGDFAIHDYEAPFEISEYDNIENLNELVEKLDSVRSSKPILEGNYTLSDAINFASEIGRTDLVDDLYENDRLNDYVAEKANEDGWLTVKNVLNNIYDADAEYFQLDGYGNMRNVSPDFQTELVNEVFEDLKAEYLDRKQAVQKDKNTELER